LSSIKLERFSGTHYEIGVQQGKAVRELLHQTIEQIPNFEEVKRMKPRLMPTSLFMQLARRRATKTLENDIFQNFPEQAERLKGIAEGAEIDVSWVFFSQSMELLVTFGSAIIRVPACTSLGFNPQRTTTKEMIIAKNFDYPNPFLPLHLTCHTNPTGRNQILGCTMAPLPGILDGMNEHGLTVTYNLAYTTEEPTCFAPLSIALQEMLETCKNTEEAIKFITNAKHAGSGLLILADTEGDVKTVEISHNHAATREPIENQTINTNHYHTEEMQKYEVPRNAVFSEKARKELVGKKVHRSSEERLKRAQDLLSIGGKIDENTITSVLRDHGKENIPSNYTICQHGEYASTLRSVIFYPNRRILKVLYGNPCQNEFSEFSFS
jgi:predicted choloylglycine hydrolase